MNREQSYGGDGEDFSNVYFFSGGNLSRYFFPRGRKFGFLYIIFFLAEKVFVFFS